MKHFLLACFISMFLFSCQEGDDISTQQDDSSDQLQFEDFSSIVENFEVTNPSYRGEKLKLKLKKSIKGGKGKNAVHVVTYQQGEKKGFMMLSASRKANPVLAYGDLTDLNELNLDDLQKPGLKDWLDDNVSYIEEEKGSETFSNEVIGQLLFGVISPTGGEGGGTGEDTGEGTGGVNEDGERDCGTFVEFTHGPLLSTAWRQWHPYNMQVPLVCPDEWDVLRGRGRTGCVATAIAQIMRYYEWPNNFNWDIMASEYEPGDSDAGAVAVSVLMRNIGNSVDMNYGCGSSTSMGWANIPNLFKQAFADNFYSNSGVTQNYNSVTLQKEIRAGYPVLLSGCEGLFGEGCHTWVCDGYRTIYNDCYGLTSYRMNWGWNPSWNNAWYSSAWNPRGGDGYDQWKKMHYGMRR